MSSTRVGTTARSSWKPYLHPPTAHAVRATAINHACGRLGGQQAGAACCLCRCLMLLSPQSLLFFSVPRVPPGVPPPTHTHTKTHTCTYTLQLPLTCPTHAAPPTAAPCCCRPARPPAHAHSWVASHVNALLSAQRMLALPARSEARRVLALGSVICRGRLRASVAAACAHLSRPPARSLHALGPLVCLQGPHPRTRAYTVYTLAASSVCSRCCQPQPTGGESHWAQGHISIIYVCGGRTSALRPTPVAGAAATARTPPAGACR